MNVKPLVKYFSEIHHLPQEQQLALVEQAYEECFGPSNKLRIWRNNLIGCALLTGSALVLIMVVGPLLRLPSAVTAIFMMLVVLPTFFIIQHRRYINDLRPKVQELAKNYPAHDPNIKKAP